MIHDHDYTVLGKIVGDYFCGFAGMIIRGGATSDIIHFIEAAFMLKMFEF